MAARKPPQWQNGSGWQPLLHSHDFGEWDAALARTIGHHRSRLREGSGPFDARMRCAQVEDFRVIWLQGTGRLELQREQCGDGVLWLPLQGLMQETINGEEHLAEPGSGLLFQPGDAMTGLTQESISGVSIVVPGQYLVDHRLPSPLLRQGMAAQALIHAGWELVQAAALEPGGAVFAAEHLADALHKAVEASMPDAQQRERVTAARRRALVGDACAWMQERLAERFSVVELSAAMNVSVRTVQTSFQTELGCSPMAEIKRMRLHNLRRLLLDPELKHRSVSQLMTSTGLLAYGVTAADYQRWCGELPRRTRRQNRGSLPGAAVENVD